MIASERHGRIWAQAWILFLLSSGTVFAQDSGRTEPSFDKLQELMNTPVIVAAGKPTTMRDSPGVITVMTREEIQDSGARDMIDVLRMVPGFDLGTDVQGVVGPSFRGIWGYEGKILMLWDGIEMNENLYGTTQLGNHYPVDQIQRIEIIRGPGSSIYGGWAEVAVIQITSLRASDVNGVGAGVAYGQGTKDTLRRLAHLVYGQVEPTSWGLMKVSLGAFGGSGQRTDHDEYRDTNGASFTHQGNWDLKPLFVNLGFSLGGFHARIIADHYRLTQRTQFGANLPYAFAQRNVINSVDARYNIQLSEGLTLTPYVSRQEEKPWSSPDQVSSGWFPTGAVSRRDKAGFSASWDPRPDVNLLGGFEYQRDHGWIGVAADPARVGEEHGDYWNRAAYAQFMFTSSPFTFTAGLRSEQHKVAGSASAPRLAFTYADDHWHFKALYSRAFRSPSIENIGQALPGEQLTHETTRTTELEVGRNLGEGILTLNLFDTQIHHPFLYLRGYYQNTDSTGSRGAELEYKLRSAWGYLNCNVATYTARNKAPLLAVPGQEGYFLGAPRLKLATAMGLDLGRGWRCGPSLIYLGRRYGYDWAPERAVSDYRLFKPDLLVNASVNYTHDRWTGSLTVFDLLNRRPGFIQPYQGQQNPLPGPTREIVLKVQYGF